MDTSKNVEVASVAKPDCTCEATRPNELPVFPVPLSCYGQLPACSGQGPSLQHTRLCARPEWPEARGFPPRKSPEFWRVLQMPYDRWPLPEISVIKTRF